MDNTQRPRERDGRYWLWLLEPVNRQLLAYMHIWNAYWYFFKVSMNEAEYVGSVAGNILLQGMSEMALGVELWVRIPPNIWTPYY